MARGEHVISLELSVIYSWPSLHEEDVHGLSAQAGYRSWESPAIVYNLSGLTAKRQKMPHSLQPSYNRERSAVLGFTPLAEKYHQLSPWAPVNGKLNKLSR